MGSDNDFDLLLRIHSSLATHTDNQPATRSGLPRPNPTESYWQQPPHPLANTQSSHFPGTTDIAIIGSGITGLSVTKTLLELHTDLNIKLTVLEARTLCSAATGRNGGQLASNASEEYSALVRNHGSDMAGRIVRFTLRNLEMMRSLIEEYAPLDGELERVRQLRVFMSPDAFEGSRASVSALEMDHPDLRGVYEVVDSGRLLEEFGIHGSAGAALLPAGTVWPYRVATNTFAALLQKYPSRLTIETNTPVTSVSYNPSVSNPSHPYMYTLHTPRGPLHAAKIIYCTNGYTGHLLPNLRGPIYPFKGTMTVQDPGNAVPNYRSNVSWAFHYPPSLNKWTRKYDHGLYYLPSECEVRVLFLWGENASHVQSVTADDGFVEGDCVECLRGVLPRVFDVKKVNSSDKGKEKSKENNKDKEIGNWPLISSWTGIMGFSFDSLPLVGNQPESLTNRPDTGEWIAAAFNGYGMANCLLSGEALARMILGEDVSAWFPGAYLVSEDRLRRAKVRERAKL